MFACVLCSLSAFWYVQGSTVSEGISTLEIAIFPLSKQSEVGGVEPRFPRARVQLVPWGPGLQADDFRAASETQLYLPRILYLAHWRLHIVRNDSSVFPVKRPSSWIRFPMTNYLTIPCPSVRLEAGSMRNSKLENNTRHGSISKRFIAKPAVSVLPLVRALGQGLFAFSLLALLEMWQGPGTTLRGGGLGGSTEGSCTMFC
ncbi:unnamed protein product [Nezara viridula]|uniref:Neuropeptide n=1 Tax=Nezara viridula TaxID=85310 RepID=A0A9P0EDT2_NEZVI|nr:unnamed protein product [Nezara viridula]